MHAPSCVKSNNARTSPAASYNINLRSFESPNTFPGTYEYRQADNSPSPYIRPESANILASSYTCITPINGDSSIDSTLSSLDTIYVPPQLSDPDYNRPDSVLSLPPAGEHTYVTTDGYLPKSTTLLVPVDSETEYYDPDVNYNLGSTQQCHTYPGTVTDGQSKLNNGLNDGCLV